MLRALVRRGAAQELVEREVAVTECVPCTAKRVDDAQRKASKACDEEQVCDAKTSTSERTSTGKASAVVAATDVVVEPGGLAVGSGLTRRTFFRQKTMQHVLTRKNLSKYGVERFLIDSDGAMRIRDQHVDVASRFGYPLAYVIVLGLFFYHPVDQS